jgi:hypothetical protein
VFLSPIQCPLLQIARALPRNLPTYRGGGKRSVAAAEFPEARHRPHALAVMAFGFLIECFDLFITIAACS